MKRDLFNSLKHQDPPNDLSAEWQTTSYHSTHLDAASLSDAAIKPPILIRRYVSSMPAWSTRNIRFNGPI